MFEFVLQLNLAPLYRVGQLSKTGFWVIGAFVIKAWISHAPTIEKSRIPELIKRKVGNIEFSIFFLKE